MSRLDEIPQLWCVLKGDMHFVGPRPERPEFVEFLSKEIPYYGVRHMVRPGITGWAQVQYKYGNTLADAREKLQYDLFYIKNASVGLDFWIVFQTIKIVLLGRGAR
jgi:lipopolysaccharide/colanic/teichoic acid biosynthesis glycosyltransferase